jgi:hypothetical protein
MNSHLATPQVVNWDTHFKQVSARTRPVATFGANFGVSFLGVSTEKTIADLRQLIKAKDDEIAQMEAHLKTVKTVDPDWTKDWNNLKARYSAARDAAQHAIDSGTGGFLGTGINRFFEGFTTAKQYIDNILKALKQAYPDLTVSKGDIQDLYNRMPFEMRTAPQPGSPPSSQVYRGLDTAAKYAPDPVKGSVAMLDPNLVPKTKDEPSYKKAADKLVSAGDWITKNLFLVAVIGGSVAIVSLSRK